MVHFIFEPEVLTECDVARCGTKLHRCHRRWICGDAIRRQRRATGGLETYSLSPRCGFTLTDVPGSELPAIATSHDGFFAMKRARKSLTWALRQE